MSRNPHVDVKVAGLGRRVLAGAGWSLASRVTVAALGLVASAILTRLLPADQMGVYLLAASLVAFTALVACAGVNQLCIRYVAEHLATGDAAAARAALRALLVMGVVSAALGAVLFAGVVTALGGRVYAGSGLGPLSLLLGLWVLVSAVQSLVADSFRGLADIRSASLHGGPVASLLVVAGLLLVITFGGDFSLAHAVLVAALAAAVSSAAGALALRRQVSRLPRTDVERTARLRVPGVLGVALPLVLTTALLLVLGSADLWVLAISQPPAEVAVYGIAARTATLVGMPLLVIYGVLPPLIAGLHTRGEHERLQQLLRASAALAATPAVLLAAVFTVGGGPILGLVYGDHYRAGALPLALLSAGHAISVMTGVCGLVLAMVGHQRLLLLVTATSVVTTVAALLVTVPVWGTTGAAVVAALGLSGQNIVLLALTQRVVGVLTLAGVPRAEPLRQALR